MVPDLYLIRHGQTLWNSEGRLQGRLDSPLTPLGRAQVQALAPLVAGIAGRRLSSPLGRARATARLLFGPDDVTEDARLSEIDVGDFSGRLLTDLCPAHPDIFALPGLGWYDRCPRGEGLEALAARCGSFLRDLDGPAVIVGHGVTLRMIWSLALGAGPERMHEPPLTQGGVLAIRQGRTALLMPEGPAPRGRANGLALRPPSAL